MDKFKVTIENFEGPLDLMLHLIKEKDLDLFDLNINELVTSYLNYLESMKKMHLEIASEYLSEISGLIEYKSKKLLPVEKPILEAEYEEDQSEKLIARLIEYKKYKEITAKFKEMNEERLNHYIKTASDLKQFVDKDDEKLLSNIDAYRLFKAIQKLYKRKELEAPLETKYARKEVVLEECVETIRNIIKSTDQKRFNVDYLFKTVNSKQELVMYFLALLDLARLKEIEIIQENNFEDIYIEVK